MALPALALLAALLAYPAYLAIFTAFEPYDDEGYWLIALRSFHLHGSLYHNTWTQAGPAYYEFWSLVYSVLGLPVNHDTGGALTLVVWLSTALLAGVAVWLFSHRLSVAAIAELAAFLVMSGLRNEAMEPAGLASLLVMVATIGALVADRGHRRLGMAVVGSAAAGAVLSKVNVGVFVAGAAVVAVLFCWHGGGWWARLRRIGAGALVVLIPFALMAGTLTRTPTRRYLHLELLSLAGLLVLGAALSWRSVSPSRERIDARDAGWFAGSAAALSALVAAGVLLTGTSPAQLLNGAFLSQRNLAKTFSYPLYVSPAALRHATWAAASAAALAAAIAALRFASARWSRSRPAYRRAAISLVAAAQVAAGVWIPLAMFGEIFSLLHWQAPVTPSYGNFVAVVPLTWLGLLGPGWLEPRFKPAFSRVFICVAATLITLEAYPVDGDQLGWACLGLVPLAALILHDGLAAFQQLLTQQHRDDGVPGEALHRDRRHGNATWALTAIPLLLLAMLVGRNGTQFVRYYQTMYDQGVALDLPGAGALRWPAKTVAATRSVTTALRSDCSTFFGFPGLNSYYFFTGERPPTGLNTTQWMYLMGPATQQRIVDSLRKAPGLCILEDPSVLPFWQQGKPLPSDSPLLSYIRADFTPFRSVDGFSILERGAPGALGAKASSGTPGTAPMLVPAAKEARHAGS